MASSEDELDPLERESQAFGKILMHFQHDAIAFSVIQVWEFNLTYPYLTKEKKPNLAISPDKRKFLWQNGVVWGQIGFSWKGNSSFW